MAVAAVVVACGPTTTTSVTPSHTSPATALAGLPTSSNAIFSAAPTASPPPWFYTLFSCDGSIGPSDPVAVVFVYLSGTPGELVLRDYADASNPRTVCEIRGTNPVQLLDARHALVEGPSASTLLYAVVDLPSGTSHWFQLPDPAEQVQFPTVGPALDRVLWVSSDIAGNSDLVHLTTSAGDAVIASVSNPDTHGLGAYVRAAFSGSGKYAFVLDDAVRGSTSLSSLLILEGSRAVFSLSPPSGGWAAGNEPLTPSWAPGTETLYFLQNGNVWRWTSGSGATVFLAGVDATSLSISADGRYLAFVAAKGSDSLRHTYLVDLSRGGSPQLLGNGGRFGAQFLDATMLFYMPDVALAGGCGPAFSELVYDTIDHSETNSNICTVFNTWPAVIWPAV